MRIEIEWLGDLGAIEIFKVFERRMIGQSFVGSQPLAAKVHPNGERIFVRIPRGETSTKVERPYFERLMQR